MVKLNKAPVVHEGVVLAKTEEIIYNKLGTNIGAGRPVLEAKTIDDKKKQFWIVPLEADYPRIIKDQRTGTLKYVVFHIGKVGEIVFEPRRGRPLRVPKRGNLDYTIGEELTRIRTRIENLLLRTASLQFARLVHMKHIMSPLLNLITSILKHDMFEMPDLESRRGQNLLRYVDLLKKRDFVHLTGSIVRPSADLQDLFQRTNENYSRTIEYVLKDMIENEYDTIYRQYKVKVLFPYIQISSSYYDYALSARDLIAMSEEDLWFAYSSLYRKVSSRRKFRFVEWLRELSQEGVGLLYESPQGAYQGNSKIFAKMLNQFPEEITRTIM